MPENPPTLKQRLTDAITITNILTLTVIVVAIGAVFSIHSSDFSYFEKPEKTKSLLLILIHTSVVVLAVFLILIQILRFYTSKDDALSLKLIEFVTPANLFSLLGILATGIFAYWLMTSDLSFFDKPNTARGLITFAIAILTVVLAVILVLAVLLGNSADTEKRFSMGKDILMVFVGILGTIMGFYYSESKVSPEVAKEIAASVSVVPPTPKIPVSAQDFEQLGFDSILANDFVTAQKSFIEAYSKSPTLHNIDEIRKLLNAN